MISTDRATEILKIFEYEPGDIVKFIVDRKLTNKELEYLLEHGEGSDEVKRRIKDELDRRRASNGTWLLETADGGAVYTDLKGRFSLNRDAAFCYAAEFVEDQQSKLGLGPTLDRRPTLWVNAVGASLGEPAEPCPSWSA